jgi:hypothetical protein
MRAHTANDLRDIGNLVAADGSTAIATGVACGVSDLNGRRLEQAQLIASETSHMILFRAADVAALPDSGYVQVDGLLYVVDYRQDPRRPRAGMWTEIFCHVERAGQ